MQPSERGRCVLAERIFLGVQNTRHFSVTTKRKMPGRSHRASKAGDGGTGRGLSTPGPPSAPRPHSGLEPQHLQLCSGAGEEACGTPAASPLPLTRGCSLHPGRRPSVHPSLQGAVGPGQGSRGPAACPPRPTADKDLPPPSGRHIHATASLSRSPNSPRRRQRPGQCGPSSCKKKGKKTPPNQTKTKTCWSDFGQSTDSQGLGDRAGEQSACLPSWPAGPQGVWGTHADKASQRGGEVSSFKFRRQGTESYSFLLSPAWLVRSVTRVQVHVGEEWDSM